MSGIAGAVISAVADLEGPILLLVALFCYLAALVVFVQGCMRLVRYSDGAAAGQPLWGIGVTFAVAAALVSLPRVLEGAGESPVRRAGPGRRRRSDMEDAPPTTSSCLAPCSRSSRSSGWWRSSKGCSSLRGASDGQPGATVSRAAMHMVGGLLGWHILAVLAAVQATLGISVLKIS